MKFLNDIVLEGANDLQFKTIAGALAGKVSQTGNDLVLSNPVGDILLGDGSSDIYIGDGTNSVDILFEQSGSIMAETGSSGVTLTLGSGDTTLVLGSSISSAATILGALTVGVDDTGHDVTFFGATSGKKMLWDQSADTLVVDGTLDVNGDASILSGAGSGSLTVGRNANENMVVYVDDSNTTITGVQDSDSNGAHSFILNRTFAGSGANNFIVQKGGTAQLTLDTNGAATFTGTIGSGAITSTGKVTGTEIEGTSLDINGFANLDHDSSFSSDTDVFNLTLNKTGGTAVTNVKGINLNVGSNDHVGGNDITNLYGAYINNSTAGSSATVINNWYGVYVPAADADRVSNRVSAYFGDNVGIGTTSPAEKLHVNGGHLEVQNSGNTNIYLNAQAGSDGTLFFQEGGSAKAKIQSDASNDSLLFTDGAYTDTMTLKGGRMGVGTTSPDATLEIYNVNTTSDGDGSSTETLNGQDSILLQAPTSSTVGHTHGSITWRNGSRRRAMITCTNDNADGDFKGIGFYTQGTDGAGDMFESMRIKHGGDVDITGNITLSGTVDTIDIATRDAILTSTTTTAGTALQKAGGTMSGAIAMGSQNITGGGTITGTTLTGTSLDINGAADISGALTGVDNLTCTGLTIGSDATTAVGKAFLKLSDVSVISYVRVNANETLSYLSASQYLSAIGGVAANQNTTGTAAGLSATLAINKGGTAAINSNGWLNSRITTSADGSLNYDAASAVAVNHDSLAGFEAAEHVNWAADGAGTIHASNYVENVVGNLGVTANGTSLTVTTTNGSNQALPAATTSAWGVMTDEMFDAIVANTAKDTNVETPDAEEGTKGKVALASTEEAQTGSDTEKAVTPAGLTAGASVVALSKKIHELTAPTAALAMNSQKITGVTDPTAAQDAATKAYTDAKTWNGNDITAGTIAAARIPTLNQNTTGSAETLRTARAINGVDFNGSADITIPAKAYFEFKGFGTSDGTNYEIPEFMTDANAPFEHDTSTGVNGLTAQGVNVVMRSGGIVMPHSGTLKKFTGWITSAGTGTMNIGLFKVTPVDDTAGNLTPVLLVNEQTTASGNVIMNSFSETSSFNAGFTAGDIIYPAILGINNKTWYFNSTLEVEWN